jgi:hypothetical protein
MAEYFCDHGAYATALGALPAWGIPQEGDGSSKDASTTSSIASIAFASVPASGTISVCGVTISTAGVIGAANADAAANALATNINASSTTVAAPVAPGAPQLRNLVFARGPAGGAPGGTCQIMMRVGSQRLNHATNNNVGIATTFSAAPTITQFAGGAGGCWGTFLNSAAMGVSNSYAVAAYGLFVLATPICHVSNASATTSAVPTANDTIWVRTGAGVSITLPSNTAISGSNVAYNQHLTFDTNTVWTGDSGAGQFSLSLSGSGDVNMDLRGDANRARSYRALRHGGLRFYWAAGGNLTVGINGTTSTGGTHHPLVFQNVIFQENTSGITGQIRFGNLGGAGGSNNYAVRFRNCGFIFPVPRATWGGIITQNGFPMSTGNGGDHISFDGGYCTVNHTAGTDPGAMIQLGPIGNSFSLRVTGFGISGWAFGRHRLASIGGISGSVEIVAESVTGFQLGSYYGLSTLVYAAPNQRTAIFVSADTGYGFRYENLAGVVDWNPLAAPAYPTRSALQMDAATPWSVKFDWFASAATASAPLMSPRMGTINRLADGLRTVAVSLLLPSAVTRTDVNVRVHYVGSDGRAYTQYSYGLASAWSSPANDWANTVGFSSHVARRVTLTTEQPVKQGTEVAVYVEVSGNPPGGSALVFFVDPEPAIT